MNMHRTTATKIESRARQVGSDVLRQWCEQCPVDFDLYEASARLAWVAEASPVPVWFKDFFRAQVLAHTIRTWHPIIIPGPLQTPDYARALHEGAGIPDDLIEDRVAAQIDLQQQTIERRPVPAARYSSYSRSAPGIAVRYHLRGHVAERAAPPAWVELRSAVLVSQLLR